MGRISSRNLSILEAGPIDWKHLGEKRTTLEVERKYHRSGLSTLGPSEVRIAWKYNDLKPRVYYSQGATAYESAKYIHQIFDTLQRTFPMTHPYTRYNPGRLGELEPHNTLYIYDYSSFTSKLTEFRYFCSALSDFCKGYRCMIFDTHEGIRSVDLGDLLARYNETCNTLPEFDISMVMEHGSEPIREHENAGLLGVYGNIVGSTVLHGLHLCEICGSMDRCNCIGDDALAIRDMADGISHDETIDQICTIGQVAKEKTKIYEKDSSEYRVEGWHFVKRPIDRFERRIITGVLFDPPNPALVVDLSDGLHTTPFDPISVRRRSYIMQTGRFFTRLFEERQHVTVDDILLALAYVRRGYVLLDLPQKGSVPGRSKYNEVNDLLIPPLTPRIIEEYWIDILLHQEDVFTVNLPSQRVEVDEYPEACVVGRSFTRPYDRFLGLLEDLGYLGKKEIKEWVLIYDEHTRQRLKDHVTVGSVSMYEWTFEAPVPFWYSDTIPVLDA